MTFELLKVARTYLDEILLIISTAPGKTAFGHTEKASMNSFLLTGNSISVIS